MTMTASQPVLVVGGGGKFAGLVTTALAKRGVRVRAMIRNSDGAKRALALGAAETVVADLGDSASLAHAVSGCAGVFHIGPAFLPYEAQAGWAMIDVAKAAGVKRFIYSSAMHISAADMVNHEVKRQVESRLIESGLDYTILQPARYMQGVLLAWRGIAERGIFADAFSADSKVAFVDFKDVAEVAAICMTQPGYGRASFELCADGSLDRHEVAAIMSRVLGRHVGVDTIPIESYLGFLPQQPYLIDGLRRMFAFYERSGFPGGNSLVLRTILGRAATDYESFFRRFAAEQSLIPVP
jgi:uncharacterized protein YbjT (DUF2867 family)